MKSGIGRFHFETRRGCNQFVSGVLLHIVVVVLLCKRNASGPQNNIKGSPSNEESPTWPVQKQGHRMA